jgi:hypothetical protein
MRERQAYGKPVKALAAIVIALNCLLFAHFAHAAAGWTDYVSVAELVPTGRRYFEVRLPVKENPSGCKDKVWFYRDYSSSGSEKMFEVLFESIKSGVQVRVYVTGVCNINGYSEISSVSVIR